MDEVAEVAAPYYNNDLRGGEGHMEVGKLILNVVHGEGAHDPVGEAVRLHAVVGRLRRRAVADHRASTRGAIFCAIETNGDGAVNVYSRVQMLLFKARLAAQAEYKAVLDEAGLTVEEMRAYLRRSAGAARRCSIRATARSPARPPTWRSTWSTTSRRRARRRSSTSPSA